MFFRRDNVRITSEADYAVRIIYCLCREGRKMGAKEISERTEVSMQFTLKILRKLVHGELACSYKGAEGGYALAKTPAEISVLDVIRLIDGPVRLNKCLESHSPCNRGECDCTFRRLWADLSESVERSLAAETFDKILEKS